MIPKIIHLLWINREGKQIPENCLRFVELWKKLHPDFIVKVWGLDEVRTLQDDMFEKLWADPETDEAAICNLIRMVIVYRFGGIYADVDTEPIKNFEPLLTCPNLGVGRYGLKEKFELNLFFAKAENVVLEYGIKFYKNFDDSLHRFGGRTPLIMDAMDAKYPTEITKYPAEFFQARVASKETYSMHWNHALNSWYPYVLRKYEQSIPKVLNIIPGRL